VNEEGKGCGWRWLGMTERERDREKILIKNHKQMNSE
jgi:hypothetical protein